MCVSVCACVAELCASKLEHFFIHERFPPRHNCYRHASALHSPSHARLATVSHVIHTTWHTGGAVDAAVAATLCIGVVNSHSSGIGGGGFMVIYNGTQAETIDFREMAPADSEELMFAGFPDCATDGGQGDSTRCPSRLGGVCSAWLPSLTHTSRSSHPCAST